MFSILSLFIVTISLLGVLFAQLPKASGAAAAAANGGQTNFGSSSSADVGINGNTAASAGGGGGDAGGEAVSLGRLRSSADEAFTSGDYQKASSLWAKVILAEPNNEENFYKRFRVYLKTNDYSKAMADLSSALVINPKMEKALAMRAKYYVKMGACVDAEKDYIKLKSLNPSSKDLAHIDDAKHCRHAMAEADKAIARGHQERAREHLNTALKYADLSPSLSLKRSQSYFASGMYRECISDAAKVLKMQSDNIPALEVRGRAYYFTGEYESALTHFRTALKSDPEHKGCKDIYKLVKKGQSHITKAEEKRNKKDYEGQMKELQALIDVDPHHKLLRIRAKLDMAVTLRIQKKFAEAKKIVTEVLGIDDRLGKAHLLMAYIMMDLEEWDPAVASANKARELLNELAQGSDGTVFDNINIHNSPALDTLGGADEASRRAEAGLKQSKQKDYYKILGVGRKATTKEIKKAYRDLAILWHPDKHIDETEKEAATKKFQLIAEAHEVLSDDESRRKYDLGEEVFPNQGGDSGGGRGGGGFQQHGFPGGFPFGGGGGGQNFHFKFG